MTEEQVFLAALDLPDPAARAAYLDQVCEGDAKLRRRVEELLAAHFKPGNFLDEPTGKRLRPDPGLPDRDHVVIGIANRRDADERATDLRFLRPPTRLDSLGRIGHYDVLQILGRGGFGIVFRAFDDVLQRVVALKVLAPTLAVTSPARKRFVREARSFAQVRHENVVQIYAVEEQPLPYLVMEFIPGETLQQRLNRTGPLEAPEIARLGRQIAEGLAAAHATGLVHRDVTPGNVLIEAGNRERVKITDFGLARAADDASLTQSGTLAGTPMYMAPEQAKGDALDHRADLFSLGSVLYTLATGRPPFRAATAFAVLKRVVEDEPRPIREAIPELPQWLADVIAKLHAKNPKDRFQTARDVADVFADCEAKLNANAEPDDFFGTGPSNPRAKRRGRRKWIAAAVLLPALALALAGLAGTPRRAPGPQPAPEFPHKGDGEPGRTERPANKHLAPEFANTLGMKFKLIPAGKFTMGASKEEIDRCLSEFRDSSWAARRLPAEGPEHEVEISQPFYMGVTEVTVWHFRQFMMAEKYTVGDDDWARLDINEKDDHPAVYMFWHNAVDFCNWLSAKEGRRYRLPTEAEWEYSCRAGKAKARYCFGDKDEQLATYAWYCDSSGDNVDPERKLKPNPGGRMHPVGKLQPNAWGLCDMHGNAWEWCQDHYDPDYYAMSPLKDPLGSNANERRSGPFWSNQDHALRGGSCHWAPPFCRSSFRHNLAPDQRYGDVGFRVLLVAP